MARESLRHGLHVGPELLDEMRAALPGLGDQVVGAIIAEVPSYADALSGPMGETIRTAVRIALGGFITLVEQLQADPEHRPRPPAVEGAYQLGQGEARSGRSMDALLAAYRIGARVSWREMSAAAVRTGLDNESVAAFAELVFNYIDELSAASAAGHTDELARSGRVRERLLERLATMLAEGATEETARAIAEELDWPVPATLSAVLLPVGQVRGALTSLPDRSLVVPTDRVEVDGHALVLVPDVHGAGRAALLRALRDTGGLAGPARPWLDVPASVRRVQQALALGVTSVDTDEHLAALVRAADPEALADLRQRVLAPLQDLRPASRDKLVETLRAWLQHHGRRDEIAGALFVHPQTVRYRMGQLRELYGDRLTDPAFVVDATVALG